MDWNRVEGNWKQFKGKVREKWAQLTEVPSRRWLEIGWRSLRVPQPE